MKSLHPLRQRTWLALLLVAAAAAAAGTVGAVVAAPQPPVLTTAPARWLGAEGITLQPPAGEALVSRSEAISEALHVYPGSQIREAVLAQIRHTRVPSVNGRLCWVVSVMPPGGIWSLAIPGGKPIPESFLLLFIDARTGQYIYGNSE